MRVSQAGWWRWGRGDEDQGSGAQGRKSSSLLRSCPRSAEELTPLHVAAAWGCRRGLELLLSRGADPGLRDQVRGPMGRAQMQQGREEGREGRELRAPPIDCAAAGWTPATGPGRTARAPGLFASPERASDADQDPYPDPGRDPGAGA